ncbi:tyrosine-type recombinase/integrase [Microbacterium suwonense]|uniref:Prophage phiRv2 integrase n=1 Tax=Microbacterium suwonense TaxID=683047 RepID=A0ABM8FRH8_9MICO|nr:tyrosine-type recombinase/integrase [Microbacterium suwonense]BDZ37985.1 putative prophage phiRv2 integrase [Microbacterium suwonense]
MTARKTGLTRRNPSEFGTVEVRGERFRALYRVKGKTFRAPKTFDTRPAARAWLADQEKSLRGGTWIDPRLGAETVGGYAEDWLTSRTDLAPRTIEFYRGALDRYIIPKLGSVALSALTPAKVNAWRAECLRDAAQRHAEPEPSKENPARAWAITNGVQIAATGRIPRSVREAWEAAGSPLPDAETRANRGDGSAAVAAAYRALKTILATAERDDIIAKNPCRLRNASATPVKDRSPATPEQVRMLADAMPERYAAAVTLAAWSGLRSGELRALARRHIDLEEGTVRVERAVVEVGGNAATFGPTKTAGSRRTVALPAFVVDELRVHLEHHVDQNADALVFGTATGAILTRHWLGDMFRRVRQTVGLPALRWHDLRHTGASLAYSVGASVPDVQKRLGHTTMRAASIYAHSYEETDKKIANRLSAVFGSV